MWANLMILPLSVSCPLASFRPYFFSRRLSSSELSMPGGIETAVKALFGGDGKIARPNAVRPARAVLPISSSRCAPAAGMPGVVGATLLGDGRVMMALDLVELIG